MRYISTSLKILVTVGLLVGVAVVAATVNFVNAVCNDKLQPSRQLVPKGYFGMHFFYTGASLQWPGQPDTKIPAGIGAWRLWDAKGTVWADLEPMKGAWNFSLLDYYVNVAERSGVELLLTLGQTPQWASARPSEMTSMGAGRAAEPKNTADWENYVRTLATRYKGRIRYYEIWNEPAFSEIESTVNSAGLAGYYSGSASKMVELAKAAYPIIKNIDPTAMIISPSMAGEDQGVKRLNLYLSKGGGDYSDIVGFHFYTVNTTDPEKLPPLVGKVRNTVALNGISSKELWNTESGLMIQGKGSLVSPLEPGSTGVLGVVFDEQVASGMLARYLVLGAASGLGRYYWFAWDSGSMGLADNINSNGSRVINYAGTAYLTTARWLSDAKLIECACQGDSVWICPVQRDRSAWIVWKSNGQIMWQPPTQWKAVEMETLDGNFIRSDTQNGFGPVSIGPNPVLFKSDSNYWGPAKPIPVPPNSLRLTKAVTL